MQCTLSLMLLLQLTPTATKAHQPKSEVKHSSKNRAALTLAGLQLSEGRLNVPAIAQSVTG